MSSDDSQIQNIYRYSRRTYKNSRNVQENDWNCVNSEVMNNEVSEISPCIDDGEDVCVCEPDSDGEITNILHKKCPVITLAQQQLQKLLDETDKLFYDDNPRCYRSVYDILSSCKYALIIIQNKCLYLLIFLVGLGFLTGLLLGAASCGTHMRKFNSVLFTCIDNRFSSDTWDGNTNIII